MPQHGVKPTDPSLFPKKIDVPCLGTATEASQRQPWTGHPREGLSPVPGLLSGCAGRQAAISTAVVLLLKKGIHFASLHPSRADPPALQSLCFQLSTTQPVSHHPSSTEGCSAPRRSHVSHFTLLKSGSPPLMGRAGCCRPCQPQTCPTQAPPHPDHPLPYSTTAAGCQTQACLQALAFAW